MEKQMQVPTYNFNAFYLVPSRYSWASGSRKKIPAPTEVDVFVGVVGRELAHERHEEDVALELGLCVDKVTRFVQL